MEHVNNIEKRPPQHVFIIGAKCIGRYGGYETFLEKLLQQHENDKSIKYHIVTTANGERAMDETKLSGVSDIRQEGKVQSFTYRNAHVVKLSVPQIGSAQAIMYDIKAFNWCLDHILEHQINGAIIYVLACRIGPFFKNLVTKAHSLGCQVFVNPDGHEWKRSKWSWVVRQYWKVSERQMVKYSDLLVCDSINIEKYIKTEYIKYYPRTVYISYGADLERSTLSDDDPLFMEWLAMHKLKAGQYYMCCGRFVRENSYEIMIREFMRSSSSCDFAIITTHNNGLLNELEQKLHWKEDKRIKFVGSVYDSELLKKIRENAYAYIHGHTVGGTNPSLLEAMAATNLSLLIDVEFNREVGQNAVLYWNGECGSLSRLIDETDRMNEDEIEKLGMASKERIKKAYSWIVVGDEYKKIWNKNPVNC